MKQILLYSTLLLGFSSMAQLPVSTNPENKNVILEEYTGIHCTYCPDGHKKAQQYKDNNPGDVFVINIHVGGYASPGSGEPDFRTPWGTAIKDAADIGGYPAGSVNRKNFPVYESNPGGTAMSRSSWDNAGDQILNEPSYVNIAGEATIDYQNRELKVTVEYYYTGDSPESTNKLNIALIQDSIPGPQSGGSSYYPSNYVNGEYSHQHMLRHLLTGQWGEDIINTTTGSTQQIVKTYTIPQDLSGVSYDLDHLEVIAFVSEGQQKIISGNQVKMLGGLSVGESSTFEKSIDIYPNPFRDITNVKFSVKDTKKSTINVFNVVGEKVISEDLGKVSGQQNHQLDGSNFDAGIYLVKITVGDEQITKKVVLK